MGTTKNTIILGDVHGNLDAMIRTLWAAGAIDDLGNRNPDWRIVQVGDLMNMAPFGVPYRGFYSMDLETLEWAKDRIDPADQLVGNHELWFTHNSVEFGRWNGMARPDELQPELRRLLSQEVRNGRFNAAVEVDGMLVTHAGLWPKFAKAWYSDDPVEVAAALNDQLIQAALGGDLYKAIADHNSIFWLRLVGNGWGGIWNYGQKTSYTQVVGHSPDWDHPKFYEDKNLWIVDSGNYMPPPQKRNEKDQDYQDRIADFVPTIGALVKREGETEFTVFDANEVLQYG